MAADAASKATSAGAISRQAAARYLARFFGIEDVEADQKLIDADEAKQDRRLASHASRLRAQDGDDAEPSAPTEE